MEILCVFAGVAFIYLDKVVPVVILFGVLLFRPKTSYVFFFALSAAYALAHEYSVIQDGMPRQSVINHAKITGYVASIPVNKMHKIMFQFDVSEINGEHAKAKLLLSCYRNCPKFKPGQKWRLSAKIKRPHNAENPGRFDYAQFLSAKHIQWTGYIKQKSAKKLHSRRYRYGLLKLRYELSERLNQLKLSTQSLAIVKALTIGVTNQLSPNAWDLFRRTGTIHLMVISGAHIGLVAGFFFFFFRWVWSKSTTLGVWCPAQRSAAIVTVVLAATYTMLAGLSIPSQRALVVCVFMLARYFSGMRYSLWQAWRYALFVVLIIDPHAVIRPGFYLSFLAVAILISINQRFVVQGIKKTLMMQVGCLVGLMPLTLFWFSYGSLNGFVANLVAVPWVGFIIIPLSLVLLTISIWIHIPFIEEMTQAIISYFIQYLSWVDITSSLNFQFSFIHLFYPLAIILGLGFIILLPVRHIIVLALGLFLICCIPGYEKIALGDVKINCLDVGQGLSVVVRTAHHTLIYDTGMKFYRGGDVAQRAIVPFLNTLGIKRFDAIVISHPDLDHRGGLKTLTKKYPIGKLLVDDPSFYHRGTPCHEEPSWEWDGVKFRFFSIPKSLRGKNNHSCVLHISTGENSILLTGDIEKGAERFLVKRYHTELSSTALLVPHHGSRTSSTQAFIEQVHPQYAFFSYGFNNRYHFPHPTVVNRYLKKNVLLYNTVDCGMITFQMNKESAQLPQCYASK